MHGRVIQGYVVEVHSCAGAGTQFFPQARLPIQPQRRTGIGVLHGLLKVEINNEIVVVGHVRLVTWRQWMRKLCLFSVHIDPAKNANKSTYHSCAALLCCQPIQGVSEYAG